MTWEREPDETGNVPGFVLSERQCRISNQGRGLRLVEHWGSADDLDCVAVEVANCCPTWRWTRFDADVLSGALAVLGQIKPRIGFESTFVEVGNGGRRGGSKDNERALRPFKRMGSFADLQDRQGFVAATSRESVRDDTHGG